MSGSQGYKCLTKESLSSFQVQHSTVAISWQLWQIPYMETSHNTVQKTVFHNDGYYNDH